MAVEVKQLGLSALAPAVISASDDMFKGEVVGNLDIYINIMSLGLTVQKETKRHEKCLLNLVGIYPQTVGRGVFYKADKRRYDRAVGCYL